MSPHDSSYDDARLVRYLLGLLPEEEIDRLDELSIADDQVAWRLRALEDDLVDSYAHAALAGELLEPFERSYLASPRRREKVRVAEDLRRVNERTTKTGDTDPAAGEHVPASDCHRFQTRSRWDDHVRPSAPWGLAAAATLLLLAGGVLLFQTLRLQRALDEAQAHRAALGRRAQELEHQLRDQRSARAEAAGELARIRAELAAATKPVAGTASQAATGALAATLLLRPEPRAAGDAPMLAVHRDAHGVAVDLLLDSHDFPRYQAALRNPATGATIWRSDRITPASAGQSQVVPLVIPARVLNAQHYSLELSGIGTIGPELLDSYTFRILLR